MNNTALTTLSILQTLLSKGMYPDRIIDNVDGYILEFYKDFNASIDIYSSGVFSIVVQQQGVLNCFELDDEEDRVRIPDILTHQYN